MHLVVLDFEMNQPSGTVIQIGAVQVDVKTGAFISEFNTFVDIDEPLDPYVSKLTGITEKDLSGAALPNRALESFWEWKPCHLIGGWGSDATQMLSLTEKAGLPVPPKTRTIDLAKASQLLRSGFVNKRQKAGLAGSLEMLGMEFKGRQHDALDDAKNAARVICEFTRRIGVYNEVEQLLTSRTHPPQTRKR